MNWQQKWKPFFTASPVNGHELLVVRHGETQWYWEVALRSGEPEAREGYERTAKAAKDKAVFVYNSMLLRPELIHFANDMLNDPDKSAQIVDEAFEVLEERLQLMTEERNRKAFLMIRVRNECFKYRNKKKDKK